MMPKSSGNFWKFSKKTPLVELFLYKWVWNFTQKKALPPVFPILGNFLKWVTFDVWAQSIFLICPSKVNMKKALMQFQIQLKKIEGGVEIY